MRNADARAGMPAIFRVVVRLLFGLGMVGAFWWWVAPRLSIPAWQVAVLPAAFLGVIAGSAVARRRSLLWGFAVVGALLSTGAAELLTLRARLGAARETHVNHPERIHEAIAGHTMGQAPIDGAPRVPEGSLEDEWGLVLDVYRAQVGKRWWEPVLSVLLGIFAVTQGAFWALRMSSRREGIAAKG